MTKCIFVVWKTKDLTRINKNEKQFTIDTSLNNIRYTYTVYITNDTVQACNNAQNHFFFCFVFLLCFSSANVSPDCFSFTFVFLFFFFQRSVGGFWHFVIKCIRLYVYYMYFYKYHVNMLDMRHALGKI